jgi:hypothetical protein
MELEKPESNTPSPKKGGKGGNVEIENFDGYDKKY